MIGQSNDQIECFKNLSIKNELYETFYYKHCQHGVIYKEGKIKQTDADGKILSKVRNLILQCIV